MTHIAILPAVFLASFIECSLSLPNLFPNDSSVELFESWKGWVFTDIDQAIFRDALAEEDSDGNLSKEDLKNTFSFIYPFTKWCGTGNVAENEEDLGSAVEADKCCRTHDHCPGVLASGKSLDDLTNDSFYSRLSCDCDEQFRQCLHKANTRVANQIGTIYFNILGQQCYRKDYPTIGCAEKGGAFGQKCLQYALDANGPRKYQWFYVQDYS